MGASLCLTDVTVSYGRHPAVHHVSGTFESGTLTAVVGPNGAGKSTLLRAISGLHPVDSGRIHVGEHGAGVAFLPQQSALDRSFPISVLEVVLLGHWTRVGPFGRYSRRMVEDANHALSIVGLDEFQERPVGTLSTGQLQRVLFARLLLQDASIILLDEPFAALDRRTTEDLIAVLERWHGESRTVIAVLHDHDQVRAYFPNALYLARECLAWGPTHDVLTAENEQRARTMAEAWRQNAEICERP